MKFVISSLRLLQLESNSIMASRVEIKKTHLPVSFFIQVWQRMCLGCYCPEPVIFTIQVTPNGSVSMPKVSPQGAFSKGCKTVPPAASLSK